MKQILAVLLFFAAATSLALGQAADKREKRVKQKLNVVSGQPRAEGGSVDDRTSSS